MTPVHHHAELSPSVTAVASPTSPPVTARACGQPRHARPRARPGRRRRAVPRFSASREGRCATRETKGVLIMDGSTLGEHAGTAITTQGAPR
ncbi:hypothetical protein Franean1_3244 [Parafrankia sp. EAN1pec]|nr:hypothetical protein Franean1_3244 [Frankia sp. EAN1pec]